MMIKLFITLMSIMMLSQLYAQEQEKVKVQFSVIYMHGQKSSSDFDAITDLYFAYGKKNVPIPIKAFRQTILYPYLGSRTLTLFRLDTKDGEEVRVPVVSTQIPAGANKGALVIMRDKKGELKITPYWFQEGELLSGARFVSLWNGPMQLYVGKNKPTLLKPMKYIDIVPDLKAGEYTAILLNGFGLMHEEGENKKVRLIRDRNLTLTKEDPILVINYQKSKNTSTMKCLRVNGHLGTVAYEKLYELLPELRPKPKDKGNPASLDEVNEWEKEPAQSVPKL